MKNKILIILLIIACLIGCFFINLGTKSTYRVSMEIKEGTLTPSGATIIIRDHNPRTYSYGEWYEIQKNQGNQWTKLDLLESELGGVFSLNSYEIEKGKELELKINWKNQYGELDKGKYRLVKKADEKKIYVEFVID